MSIVDKVIERIERKRSRKDRKREREVWDMENWLIGAGNVRKRRKNARHV